jgi:hypothetical protein
MIRTNYGVHWSIPLLSLSLWHAMYNAQMCIMYTCAVYTCTVKRMCRTRLTLSLLNGLLWISKWTTQQTYIKFTHSWFYYNMRYGDTLNSACCVVCIKCIKKVCYINNYQFDIAFNLCFWIVDLKLSAYNVFTKKPNSSWW